jgi:hypothetical protein
MIKYISLDSIRNGKLDEVLEKLGYVRTKVIAEKWGMSVSVLNKKFASGYTCDRFKINGVWYISVNAEKPL